VLKVENAILRLEQCFLAVVAIPGVTQKRSVRRERFAQAIKGAVLGVLSVMSRCEGRFFTRLAHAKEERFQEPGARPDQTPGCRLKQLARLAVRGIRLLDEHAVLLVLEYFVVRGCLLRFDVPLEHFDCCRSRALEPAIALSARVFADRAVSAGLPAPRAVMDKCQRVRYKELQRLYEEEPHPHGLSGAQEQPDVLDAPSAPLRAGGSQPGQGLLRCLPHLQPRIHKQGRCRPEHRLVHTLRPTAGGWHSKRHNGREGVSALE
jgi:hypothetical protein